MAVFYNCYFFKGTLKCGDVLATKNIFNEKNKNLVVAKVVQPCKRKTIISQQNMTSLHELRNVMQIS